MQFKVRHDASDGTSTNTILVPRPSKTFLSFAVSGDELNVNVGVSIEVSFGLTVIHYSLSLNSFHHATTLIISHQIDVTVF